MSLLKDTFYGGGLGSSIAKSDLIDHDHDHEEGTHEGSSKVKQPICDIRERTMGLCSSNWKDPVHEIIKHGTFKAPHDKCYYNKGYGLAS